ncbi:adenosylcobinamide-GDP ribazoletransferase [Actinacidiphila bryophytorum]|uniref:Adenosylcobinamide-GDP ribazoletransferase n=1 Tax=Actinacidiphila bryophytorum TaxID=1436133 RepID=A0A9W4E9W2_9ACTN|nr:adenosylcobinamide-GDP ribazoletransferase [Actinacidiphila bryophytorum]MBM9436340.1 adenosylcobinamide-GDP ribazoletransferase [Actinacidiphila bryophytorum]CAG7631565.1 Adenosylcobinamide-GDP ribazoletransferase [Actinacidiphila bryophytorum]
MTTPPPATLADALRFAFGTLTVLPARLTRWDRAAARGGMLAAPLVGAVVGLAAAAAGGVLVALGATPLLAAVGTVAVPAVLTRGLHLDGLADTADALGSGKEAEEALRIMKQSDIGPFGVLTLVLVLLAQVASAAACYGHGWVYGGGAALVSAVAGRTALLAACRRGIPAARPGGLGAAVAGSVPPWAALGPTALCAAVAAAAATPFGGLTPLRFAAAVLCGTAAGELLVRRCTRRFGGVTGDVFGAATEAAATVAFLALALR